MSIADSRKVFVEAVEIMSGYAVDALAKAGIAACEIARFVPHQANGCILAAVGRSLGIGHERLVLTIADCSNSSAATIPLAPSLPHQAEPLRAGETPLFTAAGAGFTAGVRA